MALQIDRNFEKLVDYLVARQKEGADALSQQEAGRPWIDFSKDPLSGSQQTSSRDEADLKQTFDRAKANEDYLAARQDNEAKSREVALAKLAGDFMGACERDMRARRRTRIRMIAHSASRMFGNGQDNGPLRRATVDYMERMLLKSQEKPANSGG